MSKCTRWLSLAVALGLYWTSIALADDAPPAGAAKKAERRLEGDPPREGQPGERPARRGPREGAADAPRPRDGGDAGPERDRRRGPRDGDVERPPLGNPDNPEGRGFRRPPREGEQGPPPRDDGEMRCPDRRGPGGPFRDGRPGMEGPPPGGSPPWGRGDGGALERNDPEMFKLVQEDNELERRTHELGQQFRQAAPDKRNELKKQLVELVGRQFDVRLQRRALELKRMETELTRLRESMERRSKSREQIVERRLDELISNESDLKF